jgi:hypothetical protein
MTPMLPAVIQAYIDSEADADVDRLEAFFAADAVVKDEGKTIEGLAAIKQWKRAARQKYRYTVEPLGCRESDGQIVMSARLAGDFPGSPAVVDYTFKLQGEKIRALQIG